METEGLSPEGGRNPREPKNIVVLCDGTGNEVAGDLSNVLKLFRIVRKDARQRVYYHPGVGTVGEEREWTPTLQKAKAVFGLVTGWGIDDNILEAYRFIATNWEEGDRIFLFGFSRGAYTARCLAGFIHMVGIVRRDQVNIADYALTAYKKSGRRLERKQLAELDAHRAAANGDAATTGPAGANARAQGFDPPGFQTVWDLSRTTGARRATIHFMGVWDTVASMIVPRRGRPGFHLRSLPYTRRNPSVRAFRHAMAIDERRRMFRLNRWDEGQDFVINPFVTPKQVVPQSCEQRWFPGVHSDIGGGYAEKESGLSKLPLIWMVNEAAGNDLRISRSMFEHLACGEPRDDGTRQYVPPDPRGPMHVSLTKGWSILEGIPKSTRYREWRTGRFGFYRPRGEPRPIAPEDRLDESVAIRRAPEPPVPAEGRVPGCLYPPYDPENLRERRVPLGPPGIQDARDRAKVAIPLLALLTILLLGLLWWGRHWVGHVAAGLGILLFLVAAGGLIVLLIGTAKGLLQDAKLGPQPED